VASPTEPVSGGERSRLSVRHVRTGEHDRLRQIRIAALEADPDAFGSTLAREVAHPAESWIQRAQRSEAGDTQRTFVLVDADDSWHGLALARLDDETPGTAVLNAMWVGPGARGQRGARALCDACAEWATQRGCSELTLTVVIENHPARRAYEAAGFVVCGQTTWSRGGEVLDEFVMSRRL
jgi:RimJ/RimL family protein N-acetyltransferase